MKNKVKKIVLDGAVSYRAVKVSSQEVKLSRDLEEMRKGRTKISGDPEGGRCGAHLKNSKKWCGWNHVSEEKSKDFCFSSVISTLDAGNEGPGHRIDKR